MAFPSLSGFLFLMRSYHFSLLMNSSSVDRDSCAFLFIISDPDFHLHVGGLLNPIPGKLFNISPVCPIRFEELCALKLTGCYLSLTHALSQTDTSLSSFSPPVSLSLALSSSNISLVSLFLFFNLFPYAHFSFFCNPSLIHNPPPPSPVLHLSLFSDCQFEIGGYDGVIRSSQVEEEDKIKTGDALDCIWTIRAPPQSKVNILFPRSFPPVAKWVITSLTAEGQPLKTHPLIRTQETGSKTRQSPDPLSAVETMKGISN